MRTTARQWLVPFLFFLLDIDAIAQTFGFGFERLDGGAGKDCFLLHRHCTAEAILNLIVGFQSSGLLLRSTYERVGQPGLEPGTSGL